MALRVFRGTQVVEDRLPVSTRLTDVQLLRDTSDPAESFALFYKRHVSAVVRFAASRGLSADGAADVVADTFLAAQRGRRSYRPEREDARLWLLAIASRRIADIYRRRGSEERRDERLKSEAIVLTQADRDSYDQILQLDDARALDALADLPILQQQVLRARVLEDREYAEIAEALGLSQLAARQHVSRGLSTLRRRFKDDK